MKHRILLGRKEEEFMQRMLASGRYETPSQVVLDALQIMEDEEVAREARRAALFASFDEAIADIDENGGIPAEQVFTEMEELIQNKERRDAAE